MKYVYFFGAGKADGTGEMRDLLGGKGAGLAEMTRIGLPVPAGFTITTETCDYFFKHGRKYPKELRGEVAKSLARLEKLTHKKFGRRERPAAGERALRLGALDAGNDGNDPESRPQRQGCAGPRTHTKNERFAYDAYRRFVQMYSSVVIGLPKEELEHRLRAHEAVARGERRYGGDRRRMDEAGWRI